LRYRLEFIGKGHQRSAVRRIADRAFALCPRILNDAREAPWAIDIHPTAHGESAELRPRLSPDPRYTYRCDDVPAASHPPLAACLARAAGHLENARIWDPFCGSGLELIERALLGGVQHVYGTDRDAAAIGTIERNFAAAQIGAVEGHFQRCDFREIASTTALASHSLDLIITNPPLGRRVRIPNLRGLFDDLFATAAQMLRPGGRMVLTNPFRMESPQRSLKLQSRQVVDLGGFDCRLEVYQKAAR
jgi:23S rRNA G2445 N2-methylase RlmL